MQDCIYLAKMEKVAVVKLEVTWALHTDVHKWQSIGQKESIRYKISLKVKNGTERMPGTEWSDRQRQNIIKLYIKDIELALSPQRHRL